MNLTRVDSKKLKVAVATAEKKINEALAALEEHLVLLTDRERQTTPRVRNDFPAAARKLATAAERNPELVQLTEFDPEAVIEDLDNVEVLEVLETHLGRLTQMIADSRLTWLAEAYVPSLEIYGVAKVRAKKDATLAETVGTLSEVFATPRRRAKKGEPTP